MENTTAIDGIKDVTFEREWVLRRALLLDLDGTIRYSQSGKYINNPNEIRLFPDVEKKLWEYRDDGYLIIGITNQGGVAFGIKSSYAVREENERTRDLFRADPFNDIHVCYSHENGKVTGFNHRSLLRKPSYGLLAITEYLWRQVYVEIDWDNSIFVGDMDSDRECAESAGIEFQWAWQFFGREQTSED